MLQLTAETLWKSCSGFTPYQWIQRCEHIQINAFIVKLASPGLNNYISLSENSMMPPQQLIWKPLTYHYVTNSQYLFRQQGQYLHVLTVWHSDGSFIYWTTLVARKSDFHAWHPWNFSNWTVSFTHGKGHSSGDFLTFCVIGHASFPSRKYDFPKVCAF